MNLSLRKKLLLLLPFSLIAPFAMGQSFQTGTNINIPDCGVETCTNIAVTGIGTIDGTFGLERVSIKINHDYDGDLDIYLVAPDGTRVELSTDNGGSGNDYGSGTNNNAAPYTVFDMTAGTNITAGTAPFTATYLPEGDLGDVNNGQNADGTWQLCVTDDACGDVGFINFVRLLFSNTPAPPSGPSNDLCANAITVTCGSSTNGTTSGASTTGEPGTCVTTTDAAGVWYHFAGNGDVVTADICGAPYDSKMSIYSGSCGSLTCIDGEDDDNVNCGGNDPYITFATTAGTDYYIYVHGFSGATGTFTLNISCVTPAVPGCASVSTPSDGATDVCNTGTTLDWNAPSSGGTPTGYYIYFGTNTPPTNIENGTDLGNVTSYNPGVLANNTTYYWQIVPYNGVGSATGCSIWSFTTGGGCYTQSTTTVNTCGGSYFDSGGSTGDYSSSENSVMTFCPDVAGQYISISWNDINLESCCDGLIIYNGPNTGSPVLGTFTGTSLPCDAWSSDASGCVTFEFISDGSVENSGWDATINCVATPNPGPGAGATCANPSLIAALPYSQSGENTACMVNDYDNTSPGSCASSYESGEDFVYEYVATGPECIEVSLTAASTDNIGFQVYDGCPDAGGTSCVANFGGGTGGALSGIASLPGAGTYYIIIDTWSAPASTTYNIDVTSFGSGAPNDLACDAVPLGIGVNYGSHNVCSGSTGEASAPACWSTGTVNSVWFSFVAPASGEVIISTTEGTINGTQIQVFSGTCTSGSAVGCNEDAPACGSTTYNNSYLNLTGLTPGDTYLIRVDGEGDAMGTFNIQVVDGTVGLSPTAQDCQQPNPVCNQVITIGDPGYQAVGNYCDFGTTSTSCLSAGERGSVWYTFDIDANGTLEFNIVPNDFVSASGSHTDYDFAVWDVTGLSNYCPDISSGAVADVRCNYSSDGVTGLWDSPGAAYSFSSGYETSLPVLAGETYLLVISNYSNSTSGFAIDFFSSPIDYVTTPTTMTWTGALDSDWFNPENWGSCGIPDCGTDVIISPSSLNQPVINAAGATCKDVTIDPGAELSINAGFTLSVCGNYRNDGTLTADPTSTVEFVGTGTQNVDGNLIGVSAFGHFDVNKASGTVSLNQNIEIVGDFNTVNGTSIFNSNGMYITLGGDFNNFNAATTFTNVGTTGTLEFNGTAAQAYNPGGTLTLNDVVMNHTSTGVTANANLIMGTSGTLTLTNGVIITNANRVIANNTTPASVPAGNAGSYVQGNLRRFLSPTGVFELPVGHATQGYQRATIEFTAATSIGYLDARFDPWGANPGPLGLTECSVTYDLDELNNGYWTINANANANTGTYNTTLYNTNYSNHIPASGWTVTKNGGSWGLDGTCAASTAAVVQRNSMSGFSLFATAQSTNPLPIELLSFTGTKMVDHHLLEWKTASETNNDYFVLERSEDAINFEPLGTVDGAGTSNTILSYSFNDYNPLLGVNYYRLKQVDFNQNYEYSDIVALEHLGNQLTISEIYPNPANNEITVSVNSLEDDILYFEITDLTGRAVYRQNIDVSKGNTKVNISTEKFANGVYMFKALDADSKPITVERLVKQ